MTLAVDPFGVDSNLPDRILDMLDAHTVPDPDNPPSVDANAVRVLAGMLRLGVPVSDPAAALTACLQDPLPDPTHGG